MMRRDTNSGYKRRASVGRLGRFVFTQDALHRPATDLNACSHQVSGNGLCPKLWLGTELAQLMDGPTDRIVNPVPPWAPKQARRITSAIDGLYPVAHRVRMQDEPLGDLGAVPVSHPHDLKDSQPLIWRISRPSMRRKVFPLPAEDLEFTSKQFYFPADVVTLGHQSQDWGRTGCNPRPRELIRLGEDNGHGINDSKGSSIAEYWHV